MTRRTAYITIGALGILVTAWTLALAMAKFDAGAMSALDLGIYTQVAWLTAHAQWFGMTIHPHLYLGDHVELLFALVAIPFRFGAGPLSLIALQCLATVGAAFALFRFAKRYVTNAVACGTAILFLLNPFTLNALAFEFHALLFGLPFAFLAADAYSQKKLGFFWLWSSALLITREDLALLMAGFAIIALLEKRHRNWWLWPLLAALGWYVGAGILAGTINGEGYKFLSLFQPTTVQASTLGNSLIGVFQIGNFLVLLALLLSVLGLPLLAWRWLTLLILPLIGIGISGVGSGDLILQTHYAAFFLPGLFCGALLGWVRLWQKPPQWLRRLGTHSKAFTFLLVGIVSAYSLLTFGPTIGAIRTWSNVTLSTTTKARETALAAYYQPTASALVGYAALTDFAKRPHVYAAHYAFIGKRQFSERNYPLPDTLDVVVMDAQDFVTYQLQFAHSSSRSDEYTSGAERFRMLLAEKGLHLTRTIDTLLIFEHEGIDLLPKLVTRTKSVPLSGVEFGMLAELHRINETEVLLQLHGQVNNPALENIQARLRWYDANNKLLETRLLPLGYGLYPTTGWQPDEVVTTRFTIIPPVGAARAEVEAIAPHGHLQLNGWRAAEPVLDTTTRVVSPVVPLVRP